VHYADLRFMPTSLGQRWGVAEIVVGYAA